MVDHFHISGVPDEDCDGTKRALLGKDQLLLEPAEYYVLMIVPLCIGYELFGREKWLHAAVRLCNHVVRSSFPPAIMQAALCQHTQSGFPCGFHHVFVQKFLADARRHQQ